MDHRITRADVEHVCELARLALSDDEMDQIRFELAEILEYEESLASLDLSGVPPTAHPLSLVNVFRPDTPRPGVDRDEVLAVAPEDEEGRFRVPRILEEPS